MWATAVRGVIESMNAARFVHDRLEEYGWDVLIADAQKVKGLVVAGRFEASCGRPRSADAGACAGPTAGGIGTCGPVPRRVAASIRRPPQGSRSSPTTTPATVSRAAERDGTPRDL
jgi:hypothetical protein